MGQYKERKGTKYSVRVPYWLFKKLIYYSTGIGMAKLVIMILETWVSKREEDKWDDPTL